MSPNSVQDGFATGGNQYQDLKNRCRQRARSRMFSRAVVVALVVGVFQLGILGGMLLSREKEPAAPANVYKAPLPPRITTAAPPQQPAPPVPSAAVVSTPRAVPVVETKPPTIAGKTVVRTSAKQGAAVPLARKRGKTSPLAVPAIGDEATRSYAAGVIHRIDRYKEYPKAARLAGMEGRCVLVCIIRRDGSVLHSEVVTTSGHRVLDQAAMSSVNRIGAFPRVPDTVQGEEVSLHIPVTFRSDNR